MFFCTAFHPSPARAICSLFSVLRSLGANAPTLPCRGVWQSPTSFNLYFLFNLFIGVREHAKNLHQSVLPKVFLAKRRNNLRFPLCPLCPL